MNDNCSDQTLTARARRGDQKAQMQLYDRHFPVVYRSAFRVLRNCEDAEEVAQESFLKFFSTQGDDLQSAVAMLRRIAINGAIDALRRRKVEFTALNFDIVERVDEPVEVSHFKVGQILEQIDNLKDPYRTTLMLNIVEGLDYDEISNYLNVSASTVRSHVSRAKKIIISQLNNR